MRIKALLFFISTFLVCANVFSQYNWTRDSSNPVLTGDTTAIQNLADPSVIYDNGVYKLWCGCVQTNPAFASVCYSESTNGSNWSAPIVVFSPNLTSVAWDNMKTEIPTVIKDTTEIDPNKLYKMWYGGADSLKSDSTRMGYAYSPDGQVWTRISASLSPYGLDGLVLVPGYSVGDAAVISDPSVVKIGGIYHAWYNSWGSNNDIMISHAISGDGYNWVKDTANPVLSPTVPWENFGPSGITADMSQPYVMIHPSLGNFLMCYGSFDATIYERYSGFGYASSNDGSNWTKDLSNPFFLPDTLKQGEEIGIHANSIVYVNGLYHMFYGGINNVGARNILHATANSFPLNSRKILNSTHLKLYPNPVTNELLIENGDLPIDIIEIISITGEKIKTILPKANKIDLTNLPIGMYLIYIKSKSIIITRKLIKY